MVSEADCGTKEKGQRAPEEAKVGGSCGGGRQNW